MADELQALLERLDQEGIRKGEEEKARLIAQAQSEAKAIVDKARDQAQEMVALAEAECKMLRQKADEAMKLSGRQVLLQVRQELQNRVQGAVAALLQAERKPGVTAKVIAELCANYLKSQGNTDDVSVLVPAADLAELTEAVKAALAVDLQKRVTLKPDKRLAGGFQLTFSGKQVVYDFTDEALAEAIAAHLSPTLGALITE